MSRARKTPICPTSGTAAIAIDPPSSIFAQAAKIMACAKDCRGARLGCAPPRRGAPLQKVAPSEKHRRRSPRPDPAEMVPDKSPPLVKGSAQRRGRELVEGGREGRSPTRRERPSRLDRRRRRQVRGGGRGGGVRQTRKVPPPPPLPQCGLSRQTAPAAAGWRSGGRRLAADGSLTPPEPP